MPSESAPNIEQAAELRKPIILLPEPNDPVVAEYLEKYAERDNEIIVRAQECTLEESAEMLKNGEVDAVVVGATHPSKDVFLTAVRQVGAENKDASSFFVMEREGDANLIFADCAVNPDPDVRQLATIAEQSYRSATRLNETDTNPIEQSVAFISPSEKAESNDDKPLFYVMENGDEKLYIANYTTADNLDTETLARIARDTCDGVSALGDEPIAAFLSYSTSGSGGKHPLILKAQDAANTLREQRPEITVMDDTQYDTARSLKVYKKKNAGNEPPNGKLPNVIIPSDPDTAKSLRELLEVDGGYTVTSSTTLGIAPTSVNTHPTDIHPTVQKVQEAAELFQSNHPLTKVFPGISYREAREKGATVFIFSNLNAGNSMYKAMELEAGYSGIGPLMQGLDNDADFHDLSRGVTPETLERICLTVGRLASSRMTALLAGSKEKDHKIPN